MVRTDAAIPSGIARIETSTAILVVAIRIEAKIESPFRREVAEREPRRTATLPHDTRIIGIRTLYTASTAVVVGARYGLTAVVGDAVAIETGL